MLAAADRPLHRFELALARLLPPDVDPLRQTGAVANTCLLIAIATGILLLFWYVPSVHQAYGSMQAIEAAPWTAGLVRNLHRYSSDACMLFVLVHAAQIVLRRRFTGARWLAWITGGLGLLMLWLVGWLGYWLVWDQPAQQVAVGTAQMLDVLPVFIDPLSRSFAADGTINSLLFFVVFFVHMLLPVALGVALWLHIARLARSRFLAGRRLTAWILGSLVLVSLLWPAAIAAPARMAAVPEQFAMDWWYLAPLLLTDRLGGGLLWLVLLVAGAVLLGVPWWTCRGRFRSAAVETPRCNACTQCAQDCPYGAIQMVPRSDGKDLPSQAQVDPSRCIGCGICAGSCDSTGVGLPWFPVVDLRLTVDGWLEQNPGARVLFGCSHSAAAELTADAASGDCAELAGAKVLAVPCLGWVHMLSVERALRHGASEVVLIGCGDGGCRYREGTQWTLARLDGTRRPALRDERVDRSRIRLLSAGRGERMRLLRELDAPASQPRRSRRVMLGAGLAVLTVLTVLTVGVSNLTYSVPADPRPCLTVSFKHAGRLEGTVRERSAEELQRLPFHMRQAKVVERTRSPVRLRISVDGVELLRKAFEPKGIWNDGNSIGFEEIRVEPGPHLIEVAIGETRDADEWSHTASAQVEFRDRRRCVVTFDRDAGFAWH